MEKKVKSAQKESEKKETNSGQMETEKETKSALKEKRDQQCTMGKRDQQCSALRWSHSTLDGGQQRQLRKMSNKEKQRGDATKRENEQTKTIDIKTDIFCVRFQRNYKKESKENERTAEHLTHS